MKLSRSSKLWVVVLAAGLVSGISGLVEARTWNVGHSIGLGVWLVLALCVGIVIRRENRTPN